MERAELDRSGRPYARGDTRNPVIYITGHRNPDTDSIGSAIGYAELKRRLDPRSEYVPARLGEANAQTRWLLGRSGAAEPDLLPHVMLRVCDVMREGFPVAQHGEPVRAVGQAMAGGGLDLMPIVDEEGALVGVMTERALARRYIRESREASSLVDAPTSVSAGISSAHAGSVIVAPIAIIRPKSWIGPTRDTISAAKPAASVRIATVIGALSSSIVCTSAAWRSRPLRRTSR